MFLLTALIKNIRLNPMGSIEKHIYDINIEPKTTAEPGNIKFLAKAYASKRFRILETSEDNSKRFLLDKCFCFGFNKLLSSRYFFWFVRLSSAIYILQ